ncbi:outer membrane lipoprotein-sorting protein [Pseudomonas coleopterorum]|nr:outer membrane lipoprotein-sorting protein [Pseudomonas coleopterorum]
MSLDIPGLGHDVMTVPRSVDEAAKINFGVAITGYLYCPQLCGFCFEGVVYFDRKARFASGRLIRTSVVSDFLEIAGYWIALTSTGSAYVLVGEEGPWQYPPESDASKKRRPEGKTI